MKPKCNECCDTGLVTVEGREGPEDFVCKCQMIFKTDPFTERLSALLTGQVDRPLTRESAKSYLVFLVKDIREMSMRLRDDSMSESDQGILIDDLADKISLLWAEVTK